jgi:hypothetical protein
LTTHKGFGKAVKESKRVHYTFYTRLEWSRSFSNTTNYMDCKTLLCLPEPVTILS